jgi:hypothetical protein
VTFIFYNSDTTLNYEHTLFVFLLVKIVYLNSITSENGTISHCRFLNYQTTKVKRNPGVNKFEYH